MRSIGYISNERMRIFNESRYSNAQLRPLISFVKRYCEHSHVITLLINDGKHAETSGGAWKAYGASPLTPSRVEIHIGTGRFPKTTTHRKSVGPVTVNNWREEFVLVLAHEFRHIDQFWQRNATRHYEVDAERFAIDILQEYRSSQPTVRRPKMMAAVQYNFASP